MPNFFKRLFTSIILIVVLVGVWYAPPLLTSLLLASIACYSLVAEWPQFNCWWLTPLYPVLPYVMLIVFNNSPQRSELIWLLCIAITHDSCAYLVGNLVGATKLWPRVSPGKTWEGVVGGVLASLPISYLLLPILVYPQSFLFQLSTVAYSFIVVLINIACVVGDLFESWLKRRAHLKDSGTILPGHGGILDRLDSLFGAIIFWTVLHFFLKYFTLL
jgi:phosphatidate cytidylyltransferase